MTDFKTCVKCGKEKEKTQFYRDKSRRDGYFPYCKGCIRVRKPSRPAIRDGMKWCYKCEEWKPLARYYPDPRYRDGYKGECRDCRNLESKKWRKNNPNPERDREAARRWRENNPELARLRGREWAKNNPDKARAKQRKYYPNYRERHLQRNREWRQANLEKARLNSQVRMARYLARKHGAEGTFTTDEWQALRDYYGNKCLACNEQKPLTIDHIIPLSKGGRNDIANVQPLCMGCNSSKWNRTIDYRPTVPEWVKQAN